MDSTPKRDAFTVLKSSAKRKRQTAAQKDVDEVRARVWTEVLAKPDHGYLSKLRFAGIFFPNLPTVRKNNSQGVNCESRWSL